MLIRLQHYLLLTVAVALAAPHGYCADDLVNVAHPDAVPLLPDYHCSWLANTFPGRNDDQQWVQSYAFGMAVAEDGAVYLTSYWEESGRRGGIYKDGRVIGQAEYKDDLEPSGQSVAVNRTHAYYSRGRGVLRYDLRGKHPTMLIDDVGGEIMGLAASDTTIAVTLYDGRVALFDDHGNRVREFSADHPGAVAFEPGGDLFVAVNVTRLDENDPAGAHNHQWVAAGEPVVARFTSQGNEVARSKSLRQNWVPSAIAWDRSSGSILVSSAGRDQQVYFLDPARLTLVKTFGQENGYLAGPVPGVVGPKRLMRPWGVGADGQGNLYVFNCTPHTTAGRVNLQKYSTDQRLVWNLDGLAWVDTADFLPGSDGRTIFTASDRFSYDYTASVLRSAAPYRHEAITFDPWTYPHDPRDHSPFLVKLAGKPFMFTIGQFSGAINIHRFDGEIAVPAGQIRRQGAQQRIWIDANGDGQQQDDESSGGPPDGGENFAAYVDSRGDVWDAFYDNTQPEGLGRIVIRRFVFAGLTASGVPRYAWDKVQPFGNPAGLSEIGRILYLPATDTMYLMGFSDKYPRQNDRGKYDPTPWGSAGRVIYRFDHWSTSARTVHNGYPFDVPFNIKTGLGIGAGMAGPVKADQLTADLEDSQTVNDFLVLGNGVSGKGNDGYVFVIWGTNGPSTLSNASRNEIRVYNAIDGSLVGAMIAKDPLDPAGLGWLDTRRAFKGVRRADGEFVLATEEDNRGKINLYRWKP